jgi:hypothetical protein
MNRSKRRKTFLLSTKESEKFRMEADKERRKKFLLRHCLLIFINECHNFSSFACLPLDDVNKIQISSNFRGAREKKNETEAKK